MGLTNDLQSTAKRGTMTFNNRFTTSRRDALKSTMALFAAGMLLFGDTGWDQ